MKSKPRLKEEKKTTKDSAKLEEEASSEGEVKKIVAKKWKGKDWFNILAPKSFDGIILAQTPTTDSKSLRGRNIEVNAMRLTGDPRKQHMKLSFIVDSIEGKTVMTKFNGFECVREHILRMIRKRNKKVQSVFNATTKDNWLLKVTFLSMLKGTPGKEVQKSFRKFMTNTFIEAAKRSTVNELVRNVLNTKLQMSIKKEGNKIYPVRFCEVEKIRVLRHSEEMPASAIPEKKESPEEEKEKKPAKKKEEKKPTKVKTKK